MLGLLANLKDPSAPQLTAALRREREFSAKAEFGGIKATVHIRRLTEFRLGLVLGGLEQRDFGAAISPELRRRIAARRSGTASDVLPIVEVSEADDRLLRSYVAVLRGADSRLCDHVPIIDEGGFRGLLVPEEMVRGLLINDCSANVKEIAMSTLQHDAPKTHAYLKRLCDDGNSYVNECIIALFRKADHRLTKQYQVRGAKATRPSSFTDREFEEAGVAYAERAARHHYSGLSSPAIEPMEDVTVGMLPVHGQPETNNTIMLLVYLHFGDHDNGLRMDIEEHHLAISESILDELRRQPSIRAVAAGGTGA